MMIEIAKWKHNAQSPVILMVDDLANIWMKKGEHTDLQIGEDWGHFANEKNSMWSFLNENLYSLYPHIKTTFFLVVDKRTPQTKDTSYTYAQAIDKDEKFIEFLNQLDSDKNVELAYHGTTHGQVGNASTDFIQEWDTYESLDQAIETIESGKELFKKVLGHYPEGGKYCGYKKGKYGDISINKTNFSWWCRDWDAVSKDDHGREDLSYELEYFGDTIDMPSTISGSWSSIKVPRMSKKYLISIFRMLFENKSLEKSIYTLYKKRQIISIQEHSSPYRTDKQIQYPNIVTDMPNLQYIFGLLEKLDVWYATGTEIADYFRLYTNIEIHKRADAFYFSFKSNDNIREGSVVTLLFESENNDSQIKILLMGKEYFSYKKMVKDYLIYLFIRIFPINQV